MEMINIERFFSKIGIAVMWLVTVGLLFGTAFMASIVRNEIKDEKERRKRGLPRDREFLTAALTISFIVVVITATMIWFSIRLTGQMLN